MRKTYGYFLSLLFLALSYCPGSTKHTPEQSYKKVLPPEKGVYFCAFPECGEEEDRISLSGLRRFEAMVGRKPTWIYFSQNWMNKILFPKKSVEIIRKYGSIPFIRLMSRSHWKSTHREPIFSLSKIADGYFDKELGAWAREAKSVNGPLMIEFGTEVNDKCFSWNGKWNGMSSGPEIFKKAFRHLVTLFNRKGAKNITWCFHVNSESDPKTNWNTMASYYPGDAFVDWIGVSIYGAQTTDDSSKPFQLQFSPVYKELCKISINKPLGIFEFGITENAKPISNKEWISQFFSSINDEKYPRIKAICVWHSKFKNEDGSVTNMRIDSSNAALEIFKHGVDSPKFKTQTNIIEISSK